MAFSGNFAVRKKIIYDKQENNDEVHVNDEVDKNNCRNIKYNKKMNKQTVESFLKSTVEFFLSIFC